MNVLGHKWRAPAYPLVLPGALNQPVDVARAVPVAKHHGFITSVAKRAPNPPTCRDVCKYRDLRDGAQCGEEGGGHVAAII